MWSLGWPNFQLLMFSGSGRDHDLGETVVRRWVDQIKAEQANQAGEGQPLTADYFVGS